MQKTKRNRPVLALTVSAEVHAWVTAEAARANLKPSQWLSQYLMQCMEGEHRRHPTRKQTAPFVQRSSSQASTKAKHAHA
jgi:hypothetical protein